MFHEDVTSMGEEQEEVARPPTMKESIPKVVEQSWMNLRYLKAIHSMMLFAPTSSP